MSFNEISNLLEINLNTALWKDELRRQGNMRKVAEKYGKLRMEAKSTIKGEEIDVKEA